MFRKSLSILLVFFMSVLSPMAYAAGGLGIVCRDGSCNQQQVFDEQFNVVREQQQVFEQFNVVQQVDILQKRVEFDAEYFLGLNGYYDVINELQAQEYTRDKDIILKQADQLDRILGLLEQSLEQLRIRNETTPLTPPVTPVEPSTPPVEPVNPDTQQASDLNAQVFSILSVNCASCHGDTSSKKGLQLVGTEPDGTKWLHDLSLDKRVLVYDHTAGINLEERGKKLMPLGKAPLSDKNVETLRLWMIAKAEENRRGKKND